jgi:hypothetical protein
MLNPQKVSLWKDLISENDPSGSSITRIERTSHQSSCVVRRGKSTKKYRSKMIKARKTSLKMLAYILLCFTFINICFYIQLIMQKFELFPSLEIKFGFKFFVLISVILNFLNSPVNCFIYFRYHKNLNVAVRESFRMKSVHLRIAKMTLNQF